MVKKVRFFSAIVLRTIAIFVILMGGFILLLLMVYAFYVIVKNIDHHGILVISNSSRLSAFYLLILGEVLLVFGVGGFFWSEDALKRIARN